MRLSQDARSRVTIAVTFIVALILNVIPVPVWAEQFRPDWAALILIYWCLATPTRVGVGSGWMVGLALDVLYGSLLGQNALAKALVAYLAVKFHLQLRMFPRWQQAVSVLILLAINQLVVVWIRGVIGQAPDSFSYWLSSIIGMLIWPWLFVILRDVRRRVHVT
ncbi:MAG: rod shape-determining protein MreD [Gammaproteobacteria bacterium]|nr:MAG: rod shape-determining protein MreD [Gammaproteobacteria bacterium]